MREDPEINGKDGFTISQDRNGLVASSHEVVRNMLVLLLG